MKKLFILVLAGALLLTGSKVLAAAAPAREVADPTAGLTTQVKRVQTGGDVLMAKATADRQIDALIAAYNTLKTAHARGTAAQDVAAKEKRALQDRVTTLEKQLATALDALQKSLTDSADKIDAALKEGGARPPTGRGEEETTGG